MEIDNGVDSSRKGISLFVELTGGLTNDVNQGEVNVGQQECRVNVGDFVWVIIKKLWWPGVVCDGSSALKGAAKLQKENSMLVRRFGDGSYIWCLSHHLKPFVANFDHFSNQKKSKSFIGALEKAVAEFGQRVKSEYTCSCFSTMMVEKSGEIGDLKARFEPDSFLDYIKNLARNIYIPNKIDYVINQNCLSAFYSSLGHHQIHMNQLKDNGENPEKLYETRDRRKSKFLSYPYTKESLGIEKSKEDINGRADLNLNETKGQPVKKSLKKRGRKPVAKGGLGNVRSAEVLNELHYAAKDCLFPNKSKKFDSVERFITEYRKRVFNELTEITIEVGMEPKKARKKKGKTVVSPTLGNNLNLGSLIIDFQNVGSSHVLESQSVANNRTEVVADQRVQNKESMEPVPDSNGNCTVLNFGDPPCKLKPKKIKKKAEINNSMPAFYGNFSVLPNLNGQMGLNQATAFHLTNEIGSAPPCFTTNRGEPEPQTGIVLAREPKKRGRKRKNMDLQANTVSGSTMIPDLNENKPEKKREKRFKKKEEIGVPCIDLVYNKVQQDNQELTGTAFLLKFSSEHPLPSMQDLNSVFCKYGPLNETETQILNENLSGQVVFLDSSSAGEAFWGLQNDHPFGSALVNYRIQHLSGTEATIGFKTPIKSPSMDPRAITGSNMLPDLNGNASKIKLVKRSEKIEEIQLPGKLHHGNGGTALLLKFSPDHPLPTNQDLNSVFSKYGELNEFETRVLGQNLSGQVVFVNPSTVKDAVHSLEKDLPFGPALVSYQVHHLYNAEAAIRVKSPINVPLGLKPKRGETRDLAGIKKNLEMMNLMLEKAGNTLSPEMRVKLENEIKGLMTKVSTMDGSSSSSCL